VAGLYGRILKEMGWLSKGDIVVRIPADFMGDVVGASERKTLEILAAARGKVRPLRPAAAPRMRRLACGAAHERSCARPRVCFRSLTRHAACRYDAQVLVIDEAVRPLCQEHCFRTANRMLTLPVVLCVQYGLGDNSNFMKAVVDTIVAKVQGVPGDDIAVLLLGYQGAWATASLLMLALAATKQLLTRIVCCRAIKHAQTRWPT
jgi:hypothetical protein